MVVGISEGTMMIIIGVVIYRVPFQGSVFLLYFSLMVYLAAVIGMGLFVSSLAATQQQAIIGASLRHSPSNIFCLSSRARSRTCRAGCSGSRWQIPAATFLSSRREFF